MNRIKMKAFLLLIIAAGLALSVPSYAADSVTFMWDTNPNQATDPWQFVRVYDVTAPAAPVKVAEVAGNVTQAVVIDVTPGAKKYVARAVNIRGESPNSNEVILPALPGAPGGIRISVTITIP
jgi:hypothetical protein